MENQNKLPKLRDEVAEKYDTTIQPTELHNVKLEDGKKVSVNMPELTLKKADQLVANGFKYLVKKEKTDTEKLPSRSEKKS